MATPDCPWGDWTPGTVQFCEARLCEVVREPANTWSSAAYVVMAVVMVLSRRGPIAVVAAQVLIGVGSVFFHGSGTFAGELVDQGGMYLLSCLILAQATGELRGLPAARVNALYAGMVALSVLINVLVQPIGIPLFSVQLLLGIGMQFRLRPNPATPRYRDLYAALGIFAVSFTIWLLDITRVVCNPDNHIFGGHAAWHVLNSVSIAFLGRFYSPRESVGAG